MSVSRIENLTQLRAEIALLKQKRVEQELYFANKKEEIKQAFSSPFAFLKKSGEFLGLRKGSSSSVSSDWATALSRVVIPFLLNVTVFRGKGKLLKSLLTIISQRAIKPSVFNKENVMGVATKAVNWINDFISKRKSKKSNDYGIPPDSETY